MTLFPSPLGASYFQIVFLVSYNTCVAFVSVPSRGILFPNGNRLYCTWFGWYSFRPLSGHLISKCREFNINEDWLRTFPSPLGASYFQMENEYDIGRIMEYLFPSPLGASYFQIGERKMTKKEMQKFPSPLGASYFQIYQYVSDIINNVKRSFRPLSGHLISK